MIEKALAYDDVLLVPQYSRITSRSGVDISTRLDSSRSFGFPVFASPMDTISGVDMAVALDKEHSVAFLHRNCSILDQVGMVIDIYEKNPEQNYVAAAVGIAGDYKQRFDQLSKAGVSIFVLDVAHGYHDQMRIAISELKGMDRRDRKGRPVHIMAGNVANAEGYIALSHWGADSVRVGIGGGSICSTRVQTGHGVPTFESVRRCAQHHTGVPIIACGGARNSGDVVKALAAGASGVLSGALFKGTDETPTNGIYRGMASLEAKKAGGLTSEYVEGVSSRCDDRGPVKQVVKDLSDGIRSGLSYSGASNLEQLRANAVWVSQTVAGQRESSPHVLF